MARGGSLEIRAGWASVDNRGGLQSMGRKRERNGVRPISGTSIEIDFYYRTERCRERVKLKPTPANLTRAENFRGAILDAIEKETFDYAITFPESPRRFKYSNQPSAGFLLENYLATWLARQKTHLKASTFDDYRKIVENILTPEFGCTALPDLKRADVREWCNKQTASNKRLSNVQSVLRKSLQDALDDDLIDTNPLYGWRYARKEAPKRVDDIDPFTEDEQNAILSECREDQHRNLFKFAFWTGMRTSELAALEWGDIDWLRGVARVSRALTQAADEAEETKTRKSARDVKLLGPALEALQAQKQHSFLANGVIFINPRTGKGWEGDQPIRHGAWVPALRKAGVRYRRQYQTRHTYASMMLSAGESLMWVGTQMGHADWTMLGRIYGRWIKDAAPQAGEKAVKMFSKKLTKKLTKPG